MKSGTIIVQLLLLECQIVYFIILQSEMMLYLIIIDGNVYGYVIYICVSIN